MTPRTPGSPPPASGRAPAYDRYSFNWNLASGTYGHQRHAVCRQSLTDDVADANSIAQPDGTGEPYWPEFGGWSVSYPGTVNGAGVPNVELVPWGGTLQVTMQ